jgi:hypothetical protein
MSDTLEKAREFVRKACPKLDDSKVDAVAAKVAKATDKTLKAIAKNRRAALDKDAGK